MRVIRTKRASKRNGDAFAGATLVASFSYFETPEVLGGEGEFSLALDEATTRLVAAWRCKTWGDFARVLGLTWSDFVKERRDQMEDLSGHNTLRAATPLNFAKVWGSELVGDIQDPRQCAYDYLTANVPATVLDDPRLDGLLEWGGGFAGGSIDTVTALNPSGFVMLQQVLHDAGLRKRASCWRT